MNARDYVIDAALQLTAADRARVVARILDSLDDPATTVDAAWVAELERRFEFEGSAADFVEMTLAKEHVEKELGRK